MTNTNPTLPDSGAVSQATELLFTTAGFVTVGCFRSRLPSYSAEFTRFERRRRRRRWHHFVAKWPWSRARLAGLDGVSRACSGKQARRCIARDAAWPDAPPRRAGPKPSTKQP